MKYWVGVSSADSLMAVQFYKITHFKLNLYKLCCHQLGKIYKLPYNIRTLIAQHSTLVFRKGCSQKIFLKVKTLAEQGEGGRV